MPAIRTSQGGHSAHVKMQLLVNGSALPVVQLGPDFLLLQEPSEHPPADASVILQVDQSKRQWKVRLPQGISADSKRVIINAIGEAQPER